MKPVTDIRHLKVGGSSKTDLSNLYDEENYSSVGSGTRLERSVMDEPPAEDYHYRSRPVLTCMEVMEHVRTCPICSKLYTTSGDLVCNETGCSVKKQSSSFSLDMNPLAIALYLLLILMAIKILFK